jgi:HSP20 family protein
MSNETQVVEKPAPAEQTPTGCTYRPNADIVETATEVTVLLELPGAKADSIDVEFEDGLLTIDGKVEPRYSQQTRFLLREYGLGDYHRTFRVNERIDAAAISASYADGVLTVRLPKVQPPQPHKVCIKTAK